MSDLVSIYITTHNRCGFLKRAVYSAINQTYKNVEVIISDDGSSDGTMDFCREIIKEYKNVRYIREHTPKGANHARNLALNLSSGKFITGMDDDDELSPDRIERFVENWDPKFSFICDNFIEVYPNKKKRYYKVYHKNEFIFKDMMFVNLASNQIFTLTQRIKDIGGFNEELRKLQDWDCWLRLLYKYGRAKRFDFCTYFMFHDAPSRVTNNSTFKLAFNDLVLHNLNIYNQLDYNFVESFILGESRKNIRVFLSVRNLFEFKFLVKYWR